MVNDLRQLLHANVAAWPGCWPSAAVGYAVVWRRS
jgi:hypothetical protein